jgi:hypothetical protein
MDSVEGRVSVAGVRQSVEGEVGLGWGEEKRRVPCTGFGSGMSQCSLDFWYLLLNQGY